MRTEKEIIEAIDRLKREFYDSITKHIYLTESKKYDECGEQISLQLQLHTRIQALYWVLQEGGDCDE